jgi:PAS domain S-box-containing protein
LQSLAAELEARRVHLQSQIDAIHQSQLAHDSVLREAPTGDASQQQLQESEQRYRRLTASLTDYIYRVQIADGRAISTQHSPSCQLVTGYTPDDFAADPMLWIKMVPPEDRPAVEQQVARIRAGEHVVAIEHRIRRREGPVRWIQNTASAHRSAQGVLLGYDGLVRDITLRKREEQTLRELNQQLAECVASRTAQLERLTEEIEFNSREMERRERELNALLETSADAIVTIDEQGIIQRVNPATERMFGYTTAELLGHNVRLLMPPPDCDEHDSYLQRYLRTGQARIIGRGREVVGRRKDGSLFPIGVAVSTVGNLGLFTGILRDNSAVQQLQQEILGIAAEKDRRIGHELHDNTQQQLAGLGLLAQGLAEALQRDAPEHAPRAFRLVQGLREAADQVHLLSHGLIPVEVDAHELPAALSVLAARISEQYQVHCTWADNGPVSLPSELVATHLYRIAQEATTNAIKHGQATRIELSLQQHGGNVTLRIRDYGIGIAAQPEVRTGMGLRIMHYRAGLIGATLNVAREQPDGTAVTCTLHRETPSHE